MDDEAKGPRGQEPERGGFEQAERLHEVIAGESGELGGPKNEGDETASEPHRELGRIEEIRARIERVTADNEPGTAEADEAVQDGTPAERAEVSTLAERHPDWPPVKVKVFLSSHTTAEDMDGLDEALSGAHMYFPEVGTPAFLQQLHDMSRRNPRWHLRGYLDRYMRQNTLGDDKPLQGSNVDAQLRAVYGRAIRMGNLDPYGTKDHDPLLKQDAAKDAEVPTRLLEAGDDSDYDSYLDGFGDYLTQLGQAHEEREQQMPELLESEIGRILKRDRKLRRKPQLEAVASLGAYHTGAVEKLRAAGFDVEVVGEAEAGQSYGHEVQRLGAKGEEVDRELLEKAFVENMVHTAVIMQGGESRRYINDLNYAHDVAARFDSAESQELFQALKAQGGGGGDALDTVLEHKGLGRIPRSGDELVAALGRLGES